MGGFLRMMTIVLVLISVRCLEIEQLGNKVVTVSAFAAGREQNL
jgi:hypothetical protein